MSKLKSSLLRGLLCSVMVLMPMTVFGMSHNTDPDHKTMPEMKDTHPKVEKTSARFRFGVYSGRPYYYRPNYYYYPYRPYYYRYYYRPYYRW